MANVLLIVPDSDLCKSLDFALRADGHDVEWRSNLDGAPIPAQFECTILDHDAIGSNLRQGRVFCRVFWPVILLADTSDHELSTLAFQTVLKPMLGPALSAATTEAVRAHRAVQAERAR